MKKSKHDEKRSNIPVSLGKPSLRRRLEDYYSLIAPEVIANQEEWKQKFDQIHLKYGGNVKGERILAQKLAKKYGSIVRLRLTTSSNVEKGGKKTAIECHPEEWYELKESQNGSGIVDFTSENFDPVAALSWSSPNIYEANPFAKGVPYLDNISKFPVYLPECDPQRKEMIRRDNKASEYNSHPLNVKTASMKNKIPAFTAMAAQYENSGPISLLHSIFVERQRVRIMIRYVDCIRGTLTGFIIAFDKHMNMILRDVDEIYTSRVTKIFEGMELSKSELERERRNCITESFNRIRKDDTPDAIDPTHRVKVGRRHLQQILVRGDNIVSIWRADADQKKH